MRNHSYVNLIHESRVTPFIYQWAFHGEDFFTVVAEGRKRYVNSLILMRELHGCIPAPDHTHPVCSLKTPQKQAVTDNVLIEDRRFIFKGHNLDIW